MKQREETELRELQSLGSGPVKSRPEPLKQDTRVALDSGVGSMGLFLGMLGQLQMELTTAASMNSHRSGEKHTARERHSQGGKAN